MVWVIISQVLILDFTESKFIFFATGSSELYLPSVCCLFKSVLRDGIYRPLVSSNDCTTSVLLNEMFCQTMGLLGAHL